MLRRDVNVEVISQLNDTNSFPSADLRLTDVTSTLDFEIVCRI